MKKEGLREKKTKKVESIKTITELWATIKACKQEEKGRAKSKRRKSR